MRPVLITAIGVAASVLLAPAASATDGTLSVSPSTVEPGGAVTVVVRNCQTMVFTVDSPGFERGSILLTGTQEKQSGSGKATKKPGTYEARYACKQGQNLVTKFTVAAKTPTATPPAPTTTKPKAKPQVAKKPKGGVETGGGMLSLGV